MTILSSLRSGTTRKRRLTAISAALFTSLFLMTQTIPVMGQATPPDFSRYGTNKLLDVDIPENVSGEQARGVLVTTVLAIGLSPINYTIIENHVIGASDAYGIDRMTVGDIYYKGPALDYEALTPAERTHSLKVRAQNALGSDELIVNVNLMDVNERPVRDRNFATLSMREGGVETIDLSNFYSDPDDDETLTFRVTSDRNEVIFATVAGSTMTLRARGTGNAFVSVSVTDSGGLTARTSGTADQSFQVEVAQNNAPVIETASNPQWATRSRRFEYEMDENIDGSDSDYNLLGSLLTATDRDNDTLNWSLIGADAEDFEISDLGQISYTGEGANFEEKSAYTFEVQASDGSANDRKGVVVYINDVMEPPVLVSDFPDITLNLGGGGRTVDMANFFKEEDRDQSLIYAANSNHSRVSVRLLGHNSSQVLLVPVVEGDAVIEVCATDESVVVPTQNDFTSQPAQSNATLFARCKASTSKKTDMFDVTVAPPDRFVDDNGTTHEDNINRVADLGVTRGCNPPTNNRYCPNNVITRGQMATFLVRTIGIAPSNQSRFVDVAGTTHEADINALANYQTTITQGCNPPTNNRYCPNRAITRGEMATFLVRAFFIPTEAYSGLTDISFNTHRDNIMSLAAADITRGCNSAGTLYCPNRSVNRGEMASFLIRALDFR